MGTNYYLYEKEDCECCGRPFEPIHIGKSSGGWCFSLHVMPGDKINTLDDWRRRWATPGAFIRNEYGERIPAAEMEKIITERKPWAEGIPLKRHDVDGIHCIGQGDSTYDYCTGTFS